MWSVVFSFLMAMAVSAALTPLVRRVALAVGAVDEPTARRVHTRRIPRAGGVAIVLAFVAPLLALFALSTGTGRLFFAMPKTAGAILAGSLIVAGLGLYDDIVGVGAKMKLLVQVAAATLVFAGGLHVENLTLPGFGSVSLGWLAYPATVLWITGIVNALNLIDGLDGLAAGVAFFAALTNGVVAYLGGNVLIVLMSATLGGAIIGFLFYNFNPARIFMGDSGSMFLGFILACASMLGAGTQKSPTLLAILVPLIALGLPIMDMLFTIARRFLARRSIFRADRGHIHHRLIDAGFTHRRAVLTLYGLSLAFTVVALVIHVGRSWQMGLVLLAITVVMFGAVRFAGHFNGTIAAARGRAGDALFARLRPGIPTILVQISSAKSAADLPELLARFGEEQALLAVEIAPSEGSRLSAFRWETPSDAAGLKEAVCVKFPLTLGGEVAGELGFYWDSPDGAPSLRVEALLQLVADASETLLNRAGRARAAAAAGHLRPVS